MKVSIIDRARIDLGDRIDAEYFEPTCLEMEKKLQSVGAKPLSNYCKLVSSAFYPAATEYYASGDIPFIRCVDCIDFPAITTMQNDTFERLPLDFIQANKTIKVLAEGDIVITKVGSPCYASIIYGLKKAALSRTVLGAYNIKGIDPFYLTVFLRSKYGFKQLVRERELTIQYQLTLKRVGRILTYKPQDAALEKMIGNTMVESQKLIVEAREQYRDAERELLTELGLGNWKPRHELSFVKQFTETKTANRIDAEYYQPMYEYIDNAIKSSGEYARLGNLVTIKKCVEPGSEAYRDCGIPFLRVSNLTKLGINDDNQQYLDESLYQKLKTNQPTRGEILLSKDATPGIALYLKDVPGRMIPSSGILRLKINDVNAIYPEYLTLLLNSTIIQKQIERDAGGSIINHWLVDQVKDTLIPILSSTAQNAIVAKINTSFTKRAQSVQLLDIAKQTIDMAIETDEKKALEWSNKEVGDKCLAT